MCEIANMAQHQPGHLHEADPWVSGSAEWEKVNKRRLAVSSCVLPLCPHPWLSAQTLWKSSSHPPAPSYPGPEAEAGSRPPAWWWCRRSEPPEDRQKSVSTFLTESSLSCVRLCVWCCVSCSSCLSHTLVLLCTFHSSSVQYSTASFIKECSYNIQNTIC